MLQDDVFPRNSQHGAGGSCLIGRAYHYRHRTRPEARNGHLHAADPALIRTSGAPPPDVYTLNGSLLI